MYELEINYILSLTSYYKNGKTVHLQTLMFENLNKLLDYYSLRNVEASSVFDDLSTSIGLTIDSYSNFNKIESEVKLYAKRLAYALEKIKEV